jgi:hypothetical protein
VPIVHAERAGSVADDVRLAGEDDDGAGAAGERSGEGGALRDGQGGGGVDAALGDGLAVDGLDFALVALDDGEVARGEERLDGVAADGGCAGAGM